ncbi:hypothetical protein AgCh_008448 [Apium graveolens]
MERGQPSSIKSPKANVIFKPKRNYPKNSDKNPLNLIYETPKPYEKKLLGRSIAFFKDPRDTESKKRTGKIYRNERIHANPIYYFKSTAIPTLKEAEFKVDPNITFHGEPVIPKDEPIDSDSLPLLDLNNPIQVKPRKIKKRAIKKAKPVKLQSKSLTTPKPTVNKGDQLFIYEIKEFLDINLYLEEIDEVRAIDAYRHLPERLVFTYKGGREITWPLHRIFNEGYSTMVTIFSSIKKNFGFNIVAKKMVQTRLRR